MNTSDEQTLRKAGALGWHASRYNIAARVPGTPMTAIYNTFKRTCGEYNPLEMYLLSVIEELDEDHAIIERFARRGDIANYDEREAFEMQRLLDCATAQDGSVSITICPTLACNFDCPYCFATRGRGKMTPEVQDDVVAFVGRI